MSATTSNPKPKRNATVLVTDTRDPPNPRTKSKQPRGPRPSLLQRASTNTRLISVDNVLQYASEIPSGQRRGPPSSSTAALSPGMQRATGQSRMAAAAKGQVQQQHIPPRSSKVSEKLVLLPETQGVDDEKAEADADDDEDAGPPRDVDTSRRRRVPTSLGEKSYAERLPKSSRTERLPRVTAYCTAQAYKMQSTADFVRSKHGAKTKLYDDCLYTVYHLPLLSGSEGYRIQSSPVLKSPGGKAVLDEEIERNERHEYREGFFGEEMYHVRGQEEGIAEGRQSEEAAESPRDERVGESPPDQGHQQYERRDESPPQNLVSQESASSPAAPTHRGSSGSATSPTMTNLRDQHLTANLSTFAELFIFSYGIVVFWNFTERQEKDILADLTFSSPPKFLSQKNSLPAPKPPLAVRPLNEQDFETEEFHFEYNPLIPRPRIFNDMITLRGGDHMIKLSMSHAIAQSTKLSSFESRMALSMAQAQHIPRRLALTGDLGLQRSEVTKILGTLYVSRVDVNLSSNMLDVPNFFWESEPTLHPLYLAVREYLEIKPRIQVLNERCRVFLDLAEILSESVADRKMSRLTWIIIVLIVASIVVTTGEVILRFGILRRNGGEPVIGPPEAGNVTAPSMRIAGLQAPMGLFSPLAGGPIGDL